MWTTIIDYLTTAINAVLSWTTTLFNSVPGAWDSIFTLFVIVIICRFLLGPVLGFSIGVGSDTVQGHKNKAEFRKRTRESYNEMKYSKGKFEG